MGKVGDGSKAAAGDISNDDDDIMLVVPHVKETGVTLRYPMHSKNNDGVWAVKMRIVIRAEKVCWLPW